MKLPILAQKQHSMLPLLQSLEHGITVSTTDIRQAIIAHFEITEEEQNWSTVARIAKVEQKYPSGKSYSLRNRIGWATSYLKMADLITSPQRGLYVITELGKKTLANPPELCLPYSWGFSRGCLSAVL